MIKQARIVNRSLALSLLAVLGAGIACGEDSATPEEVISSPSCNPLSHAACALPWPSSFYLKADAATATGYRVNYAAAMMPKSSGGTVVDHSRYNVFDGFSVGSQILVYFQEGVSTAELPKYADLAASLLETSLIALLNMTTGERVPLFAEVDANVEPGQIGALIIRPQVVLAHDTRYAVVLRQGLKDQSGEPLQAPDPFQRLRDRLGTKDDSLRAEGERLETVFDFLLQQGIPREELILAWDFRTASHDSITKNLLEMVDGAYTMLAADGPSYLIDTVIDHKLEDEKHLMRQIEGRFQVPSYLEGDDDQALMKLDQEGRPTYRGMQDFYLQISIPRCAETATEPLPVMIYGHGLFVAPRSEMLSWYHKKLHNQLCMIQVGTHWRGLSEPDLVPILQQVMVDFSRFPWITDRLQQSHVNQQVLVELIKGKLLQDPALQLQGKPISDGKTIYYLGISNGGIQGVAFAALSKDIERFIFNVSAGWWSMMIERSSNFAIFAQMLKNVYEQPYERAFLVALSQHLWDYTDPIIFAPHLLQDPLPGRKVKRVLMQEARYDDQVPNMATRAVVRAMGLKALSPLVETVYGVEQAAAALDSAYAQWDTLPPVVPPETNTPAEKPDDAVSAHKVLRVLDTCVAQMEAYFKPDGKVVQTCSGGGPCVGQK
jgi:hypothetical protein